MYLSIQSAIDHAKVYHDQVRSLYKHETLTNLANNRVGFDTVSDTYNFESGQETSITKIYLQLTKLRLEQSNEVATELNSFFITHHNNISELIRLYVYVLLKMHYARIANRGNLSVVPRIFELHKLMADNNYFINEGQLSELGFMNIIELTAFLKEHVWGELFIEKYAKFLPTNSRRNVMLLSSAYMHYARHDYGLSLEVINRSYFKNITLKALSARLQLINYIESAPKDIYFLKQKIENYRLFIYRNQKNLSQRVVKSCFNLAKILNLIVTNKSVTEIEKRMNEMDTIFYRYYLTSKLAKIKLAQE